MRYGSIIIAATALSLATAATAQPVAPDKNASGKALVLVPLTLTKIDDLDFGTLIPSAVSGFVSIDATTGNRTLGGGVTGVPSAVGHRAYFGGAGTPNQQVIVTMTQPTELASTAGDKITVLALTLQGSPIKQIDPTTRAFFFGIGGILQIAADQPEGVYTATFNVSANYQ
ncbi:DUF4402 domain-containing protein [Sphingomonas sp. F9_3S_D5_B_2]